MSIKAEQHRILELTNSELQREIAEFLGWSGLTYRKRQGLYGISPENGKMTKIPAYITRADEALKAVAYLCEQYPYISPLFVYNPDNKGWYVTFYEHDKADRNKVLYQIQEMSLLLGQALARVILLTLYAQKHPETKEEIK